MFRGVCQATSYRLSGSLVGSRSGARHALAFAVAGSAEPAQNRPGKAALFKAWRQSWLPRLKVPDGPEILVMNAAVSAPTLNPTRPELPLAVPQVAAAPAAGVTLTRANCVGLTASLLQSASRRGQL